MIIVALASIVHVTQRIVVTIFIRSLRIVSGEILGSDVPRHKRAHLKGTRLCTIGRVYVKADCTVTGLTNVMILFLWCQSSHWTIEASGGVPSLKAHFKVCYFYNQYK